MAKVIFIISALMTLHACVKALPHAADEAVTPKSEHNIPLEETGPTLDGDKYRIPEAPEEIDDKSSQGQRRKRFYNYFSFGFSPFDSFNPHFFKRDQWAQTGATSGENLVAQIQKRVQDILTYTRQQALNPPSVPNYSPLLYVPVLYVPQSGCGCTSGNKETPNYGSETTNPTTNTSQATPSANDNAPVTSSPDDNTSNTMPDFFTRISEGMGSDDGNDGARPISFEPIIPDTPLNVPVPAVDHGSSQGETSIAEIEASRATTEPPQINALPAQPHLPTNSIPTLCDGAVLTCCHRPEVTIGCFVQQGCPDLSPYEEPCSANVILRVVQKFQYYYANRRG